MEMIPSTGNEIT